MTGRGLFAFTLAGCLLVGQAAAQTPRSGLTREALAGVRDSELCKGASLAPRGSIDAALLNELVRQRGLSCGGQVPSSQASPQPNASGPCTALSLERQEDVPGRGRAYFVRNGASRSVSFKINDRGVTSGRLVIGPRTTKGFGVEVNPLLGGAGVLVNRKDPEMLTFRFYDCQ